MHSQSLPRRPVTQHSTSVTLHISDSDHCPLFFIQDEYLKVAVGEGFSPPSPTNLLTPFPMITTHTYPGACDGSSSFPAYLAHVLCFVGLLSLSRPGLEIRKSKQLGSGPDLCFFLVGLFILSMGDFINSKLSDSFYKEPK